MDSDPEGFSPIPGFSQPETSPYSTRNPSSPQSPSDPPGNGSLSDPTGPTSTRPGTPDAGTRTGTSSRGSGGKGDGDPVEAGKLVAGLLGLALAIAAGLLKRSSRRVLRTPTKSQLKDISDPLGRMLVRHADMSALGPDLTDFIQAGSATGAYLTEDRLITHATVDPGPIGDPDNWQEN